VPTHPWSRAAGSDKHRVLATGVTLFATLSLNQEYAASVLNSPHNSPEEITGAAVEFLHHANEPALFALSSWLALPKVQQRFEHRHAHTHNYSRPFIGGLSVPVGFPFRPADIATVRSSAVLGVSTAVFLRSDRVIGQGCTEG